MYKDGCLYGHGDMMARTATYVADPGRKLSIGYYNGSASGRNQFFSGAIDEVKFWYHSLEEGQIWQLYLRYGQY